MKQLKKGTVVLVRASVETMYFHYSTFHPSGAGWYPEIEDEIVDSTNFTPKDGDALKWLIRHHFEKPKKGLIIGVTRRATGKYHPATYSPGSIFGPEESEPPFLQVHKYHRVYVVEPLNTEQWKEPWLCLEEDILSII